jgi:hypothetical protein
MLRRTVQIAVTPALTGPVAPGTARASVSPDTVQPATGVHTSGE